MFGNAHLKEEQANNIIQKYGINALSDPVDRQTLEDAVRVLANAGLFNLGPLIGGDPTTVERINASYTRAILEQNFVIIRQLERLNNNLERR